jgi:hypothetical protein
MRRKILQAMKRNEFIVGIGLANQLLGFLARILLRALIPCGFRDHA